MADNHTARFIPGEDAERHQARNAAERAIKHRLQQKIDEYLPFVDTDYLESFQEHPDGFFEMVYGNEKEQD